MHEKIAKLWISSSLLGRANPSFFPGFCDFVTFRGGVPGGPTARLAFPVTVPAEIPGSGKKVPGLQGGPPEKLIADVGGGAGARRPAAIHEADVVKDTGEVHGAGTFPAWEERHEPTASGAARSPTAPEG